MGARRGWGLRLGERGGDSGGGDRGVSADSLRILRRHLRCGIEEKSQSSPVRPVEIKTAFRCLPRVTWSVIMCEPMALVVDHDEDLSVAWNDSPAADLTQHSTFAKKTLSEAWAAGTCNSHPQYLPQTHFTFNKYGKLKPSTKLL